MHGQAKAEKSATQSFLQTVLHCTTTQAKAATQCYSIQQHKLKQHHRADENCLAERVACAEIPPYATFGAVGYDPSAATKRLEGVGVRVQNCQRRRHDGCVADRGCKR